jgi:uncharacterized protein YndB with AHSA1/START domain
LPRFIDRWTIEYVRIYAHPVERVWRAITDPKEFGQWFIRGTLDLKVGGRYEFETGDDGFKGVVLEVDAPRHIRFGGPSHEKGWFEYELGQVAGGTRMRFTQYFARRRGVYAATGSEPGDDLPVPGTPWKPAFVGGWHEFWDALGDFLDGVPPGSRLPPAHSAPWVRAGSISWCGWAPSRQARASASLSACADTSAGWSSTTSIAHFIRENCPPA